MWFPTRCWIPSSIRLTTYLLTNWPNEFCEFDETWPLLAEEDAFLFSPALGRVARLGTVEYETLSIAKSKKSSTKPGF